MGGVAVVDALRRLPDTIFVKVVFDKFAPERSAPAMDIPDRSVPDNAALTSETFGPTIIVLRNTYPVGNVAVAVPVRLAVRMFVIVAPVIMTPDTSELVRTIFDKSTPVKFASVIRTLFPKIDPPRPIYPVGRVVVARPMTPRERILVRLAPGKVAPERSVDTKIAFVRFARFNVAP